MANRKADKLGGKGSFLARLGSRRKALSTGKPQKATTEWKKWIQRGKN